MKYLLFNPLSGDGESYDYAKKMSEDSQDEYQILNLTEISDFHSFIGSLSADDDIYLLGGDGTLNRFVNEISDVDVKSNVYYYPAGTGNDFCVDIAMEKCEKPFLINDYIKNLPSVTVDGKEYKFINGVGFGIDGYCCEVGDKVKAESPGTSCGCFPLRVRGFPEEI